MKQGVFYQIPLLVKLGTTIHPQTEAFVDLEGRRGGLLSYLLNLAGIDSNETLGCNATKIE